MTDSTDNETNLVVFQGATQTQLMHLFGLDQPRIKRALAKCQPVGMRNNRPIYLVRDVAPHAVKPSVSPEELEKFLMESDHHALPASLRKEFWIAKRQRQDYELKAGDLWPTTRVIAEVGELFKLVNMQIRLMTDAVERQTELSDRQRGIVKSQCDELLKQLQKKIAEKFSKPTPEPEDDDDF